MKEKYIPTIGLEIHAELRTNTKMFSRSKNDPDETKPNLNISPVDVGHPGTLPTINKAAVKHVLKVGVAVGGKIADYTEFDRKNYFYPDIPKGYQISQYNYPLVTGGELAGVKLTRIHLEEDTGTSIHLSADSAQADDRGDHSLVNYNRAGVPLMELVTEPVIHSAEEAGKFARELQLLLRYLGVSEANMEKGEFRVEANISVSKDPKKFGTKVEVKNLNSFRAAEKAIAYEIERHINLLENGEKIVQETRGFDETTGTTFSQRQKEESHDYRYFPDPDLPKLKLSEIPEFSEENLRKELPELPWQKRNRYLEKLKLKVGDAEMYVQNASLAKFFEDVAAVLDHAEEKIFLASNYITSDLVSLSSGLIEDLKHISPKEFAKLIEMIIGGKLSSRGAKDTLKIMFESGGDPGEIAEREGLLQKSDEGALKKIIEEIVAENPKVVEEYKSGKTASLQFLIGQGMKKTKGSANPQVLKKLLEEALR